MRRTTYLFTPLTLTLSLREREYSQKNMYFFTLLAQLPAHGSGVSVGLVDRQFSECGRLPPTAGDDGTRGKLGAWSTCIQIRPSDGQMPLNVSNLMVPRSRCPACGHAITALENIPVVSYVFSARQDVCSFSPLILSHVNIKYNLYKISSPPSWLKDFVGAGHWPRPQYSPGP